MTEPTTQIGAVLEEFRAKNPDADLSSFDFHNKAAVDLLEWESIDKQAGLQALKAHQRLYRIDTDDAVISKLFSLGFNSAQEIAALPEHQFLREFANHFDGGLEKAKAIHERARSIKGKVKLLFGNVKDLAASHHYNALLASNPDAEVVDYYTSIPSYQDLFGSLNYCQCEHCRSIFGPSAYFLDIMRITDQYITDPNINKQTGNIPPGFRLDQRRPDLFDLPLTCEETLTVVSYLQVVNEVLGRRIEVETPGEQGTGTISVLKGKKEVNGANTRFASEVSVGDLIRAGNESRSVVEIESDVKLIVDRSWASGQTGVSYDVINNALKTVAVADFPFNLPSDLPLQQIRLCLAELKTSLASVYSDFLVPEPAYPGVKPIDVAREYLMLSIEEYNIITTPNSTAQSLSHYYGYDDITVHLPFTGAGKITFASGGKTVTGNADTRFTEQLEEGDQIVCNSQTRTVAGIQSNSSLTVDLEWTTGATNSDYTIAPQDGLNHVSVFTKRTGLTRDQLAELFYQNLDREELDQGVANTFFINNTNEGLPYLQTTIDQADPDNQFTAIVGLSLKRLDRLNRFIRLSQKLSWSYADLNWALVSVNETEITEAAIEAIAGIKKLQDSTRQQVDALCSFWHDMKTIGKVLQSNPQDFFDRVFNNPKLLDGSNPYANNDPTVPFDPVHPSSWEIDSRTGLNATIRSRLLGALVVNDNDLSEVAHYVSTLTGGGGHVLQTNLTNLTWLYRLTKLPAMFYLSVDEYLLLLGLIYYPDKNYLSPPVNGVPATIASTMFIQETARWLNASPFTVYELQYITTGVISTYVNPGYSPANIKPFINNLATISEGSRVMPQSFIFEDIDEEESKRIFQGLHSASFITEIGIMLNKPLGYSSLNFLYPIYEDSFVSSNIPTPDPTVAISPAESKQAFQKLKDQGFIVPTNVAGKGTLGENFLPSTPVDFLFVSKGEGQSRVITAYDGATKIATVGEAWQTQPDKTSYYVIAGGKTFGIAQAGGEMTITLAEDASSVNDAYNGTTIEITAYPKAEIKRGEVRSFLLQVRRDIYHTVEVLTQLKNLQQANALQGVAGFLATTPEMISVLLPFAAHRLDLLDYLEAVLTPIPDINSQVFQPVVTPASFTTANIDQTASAASYAQLVQHGILVVDSSGNSATVSANFTSSTSLSFLFENDAQADLKRLEVKSILLLSQRAQKVFSLIKLLSRSLMMVKRLQYTPTETKAVVENPASFNIIDTATLSLLDVQWLSAFKALEKEFRDTDNLLIKYFDMPGGMSCPDDKIKALAAITGWNAEQICELIKLFWPVDGATAPYGYNTVAGIVRLDRCFVLSALTGIDIYSLMELCTLAESVLTGTAANGGPDYITLPASASTVNDYYNGMQVTITEPAPTQTRTITAYDGASKKAMVDLNWTTSPTSNSKFAITSLALKDSSGQIIDANWNKYTQLSQSMLDAVDAKYPNDSFDEIYKEITGKMNTLTRDALLGYAIWVLNKIFPFIESPSDLYQYLLIDVEMSGCASTSYIAQGISSVQLYMQRCRMNLEPGVTVLEVPEVWWQWMTSYRVWEANRKIFLYPENYIEPSLMRIKTPLFEKLSDELLQTNISDQSVARAYTNYFTEFSTLAQLVQCASFYTRRKDPRTGLDTNTLYIFARTNTDPYIYYYRTFLNPFDATQPQVWTPWRKIDLTIKASVVTPAFAFDKPFIFWTELQELANSVVKSSTSSDLNTVKATIKYSFLDTSNTWVQPQELSDEILVNFKINYAPDAYIQTYAPDVAPNLEASNFYWHEIYALNVPTRSIVSYAGFPPPERIFVSMGISYQFAKGVTRDLPDPGKQGYPSEVILNNQVYNVFKRVSDLGNKAPLGIAGFVQYLPDRMIDSLLLEQRDNVAMVNGIVGLDPAPYAQVLYRNNRQLGINQTVNVIYDNYYSDNLAKYPKPDPGGAPSLALLYNVAPALSGVSATRNQLGWFIFDNGDETFLAASQQPDLKKISDILKVAYNSPPLPTGQLYLSTTKYAPTQVPLSSLRFSFTRLSTSTVSQLSQRLLSGGISKLLTIEAQETPELPFNRFYQNPNGPPPSSVIPPTTDKLDFSGSYGQYFWEIFFYAPFLIADRLRMNQRFDEARIWFQYIFNPTQQPDGTEANPNDHYWRFLPFRGLTQETLTEILTDPAQIAVYNSDPFDPDAIARLRPTAYQKTIVMKYISNLIAWGDLLFAQDTNESINQATNLYVMASDLLGPRPQAVSECPIPEPMTFNEIKADYPEGIPEFLIELENAPPMLAEEEGVQYYDAPYNDINSYFCVPDNSELMAYWDLIEDRLFKIRHCMNIKGVERQLPLFAPPINPRDLIRAAAAGGGTLPMANQIEPPIPNYRFAYMIGQAMGLAANVMQLGSALLGALEKKDAEAMALLTTTQEQVILNLSTIIKQQQINEAIQTGAALQDSQESAQARYNYYQSLNEKGLSAREIQNLQAMEAALFFNVIASVARIASSIGYAVPQFGSPFAMTYGGQQIGNVLTAASGVYELGGYISTFVAERSITMANYDRRSTEWEFQAAQAEYDVEQITYQIEANKISLQIAERELEIHEKSIEQNKERELLLKDKFTNEELYTWMASRLSGIYFQTYSLAYELAKSAQRAYQYEMNIDQTFVNFGYWDDLRRGLLAGEGLMLALNQMSKAYTDNNSRSLEITKTISLLQLNPKALLDLKATGECMFDIPEKLFDYDFPGHYCRKIKSVTISVPAVVGPYQNIKATLTQLSNKTILQPVKDAVNYLLGGAGAVAPGPNILRSNWWINQQIALSTGVNDSGMFELNFRDEQYLPFEGTGAVSTWRFSMPYATNRIDFSSISDIVIQIKYTALNGGQKFREDVIGLEAMKPYYGSKTISFSQQYSQQWFEFMNIHPTQVAQTLKFMLADFVPPHVLNGKLVGLYFALVVPEGINATSNQPYIKFKVTDTTTLDIPISPENNFSHIFNTPVEVAEMVGSREITFVLGLTPDVLKNPETGFLDPAVLQNFIVILYYDGEVEWS